MPQSLKQLPPKECLPKMISYLAHKYPEKAHDQIVAIAASECGVSKKDTYGFDYGIQAALFLAHYKEKYPYLNVKDQLRLAYQNLKETNDFYDSFKENSLDQILLQVAEDFEESNKIKDAYEAISDACSLLPHDTKVQIATDWYEFRTSEMGDFSCDLFYEFVAYNIYNFVEDFVVNEIQTHDFEIECSEEEFFNSRISDYITTIIYYDMSPSESVKNDKKIKLTKAFEIIKKQKKDFVGDSLAECVSYYENEGKSNEEAKGICFSALQKNRSKKKKAETEHREAIQSRRKTTRHKRLERNASKRLNKYINKIRKFLALKDYTNAKSILDSFVQYVANLEGSQREEWTREANKLTNTIREQQERELPETQKKRKKKIKWKISFYAYQGGKEIKNINDLDPKLHQKGEEFTIYTHHPKTGERAGKADIRFIETYNPKTKQEELGVYLDLLITERKFRHMGVVKSMMPNFVYWLDKNNLICKGNACPIDRIVPAGLYGETYNQWERQNYEELRDMYKHFGAEIEDREYGISSVNMIRYPHPERIMAISDMEESNIVEIDIDPDNIFEIDGYYFYFDEEKKQFYQLQFKGVDTKK